MASPSIAAAFGLVLREFRQGAGLSQEALADAADVERTYISLLERGLREPTLETLFALSEALSVSPSTMISRTTSLTG
jgi:transcriptional regulator with XRE-family HTH domain